MRWAVYADLARHLTEAERGAVSAALDAIVPDGGCVGRQGHGREEVYFSVEALTVEDAREQAMRRLVVVLATAGVGVAYEVQLRPPKLTD